MMKIFWSWQSDTPGKIGRHFVRDALNLAIDALKQPPDVEEPTSAETRESLHLDHDRKGVSGSPDLARTIFEKIEQSTVFVADVTLVGRSTEGDKKLINSNVAIEYGHAHHALRDEAILMVQNKHYGDREGLPFDLKHKAGPIQFNLAPNATKTQIEAEKKRLASVLVEALKPYLERGARAAAASFPEVPSVGNPAVFFKPSETIGHLARDTIDEVEYHFIEGAAFYLRLIPTQKREPAMRLADLRDIAGRHRPDVLSQHRYSGILDRNAYGVVALEPHGTADAPLSFTQLFTNGELWGVTRSFFVPYQGVTAIPTGSLKAVYLRVLENFCQIVHAGMAIEPPYTTELGVIGLRGAYLGGGMRVVGPIHTNELKVRRTLHELAPTAVQAVVDAFLAELFDLAGERPF